MSNNALYSFNNKYDNFSDEELIFKIRKGDLKAQNYLLEKYRNLVNMKSNRFFLVGAETDDMVQEGMIGLFKAIQSFDLEKNNSFKTFANLCIERQLITAIKTSNRQKHMPLNSSFSLNTSAYDENDDTSVMEVLDTKFVEDPLDTITKKEYLEFIESKIDKNLSLFEKQVLNRYIQGETYVDIASKLNSPVKSIDNAIQRIRKKAMKCLSEEE
ncbi:MAG TPA: RNA polymerase sporulation sigma factor SigH [Candidatus Scatovivens faecipullorum]|nr:RNA polymerase sporulation sigma factor SigH [Candidatus Scatovivens faecipullorum]